MTARVIVFSDYLQRKDKTHILNSLGYDATREGVVLNNLASLDSLKGTLNEKTSLNPSTSKQLKLIEELISLDQEIEKLEEFETYEKNTNMYTASKFINSAIDFIKERNMTNDIYIKYISERPGVEIDKSAKHGLFDQLGPADLNNYIDEIEAHNGNVWRDIISLNRKDAVDLDYENQKAWRDLLCNHMHLKAELLGIPITDFRWCAAFHDEGHHPHVHVMFWDKKGVDGFQTKEGIEKFRSAITNDIFKNELWLRNEYKSELRDLLEDHLRQETRDIQRDVTKATDDQIKIELREKLIGLAGIVNEYGSHYYDFQNVLAKTEVSNIVSYMCTSSNKMTSLFERYVKSQVDIASFYRKDHLEDYSKEIINKILNPQKGDRKVLQNLILTAAYEIKSERLQHHVISNHSFSSLNSKLAIEATPKEIYQNDDIKKKGLITALIKADLLQDKNADAMVHDLRTLIPDEEEALLQILDIKQKNPNIQMKDIRILNAAYREHISSSSKLLYADEIYQSNTLHTSGKLFQGFLNVLSSDTIENEQLKSRMWAIRREDEYLIKKAEIDKR